jgi:hypothetical protein
MKKTLLLLLIICFNSTFAQKQIKQIIYKDLLELNDLYDGCIIQYSQEKWIFKDKDTIKLRNTLSTLKDSSESRVKVIKIDSISGFYFVEVKFELLPANIAYINLFSDNKFEYVLYKVNANKYLKINGFLVSEIFNATGYSISIKDEARINAPKRFNRYIRFNRADKIQKYLTVSVLKGIKDMGYNIRCEPYVKLDFCDIGR